MNNNIIFSCILIMGLPGSGKSTIAKGLSDSIKGIFIESDKLHSQNNIQKMTKGIPLNDIDRERWLLSILSEAKYKLTHNNIVIACSALKNKYRLFFKTLNIKLVYLKIDEETAKKRILTRSNHFMPVSLLKSQIKILEEPKIALTIDARKKPENIVQIIINNYF